MTHSGSGFTHSLSSTPRDAVRNGPSGGAHKLHFLHITGEMTNPALLENFIVEHPMVHSAIMFGHGRYSAGVLIELKDGYKIDTSDAKQVEETRNKLQPVIDRMNMFAPRHARVQKEMILFTTPSKPFAHAPLSTPQANRRDTLAEYSDEINALYETISQVTHMSLKPPKIWTPKNTLVYVRGIIVAVLGKKLEDDADLFNYGTDSLQATRIRIILFHALHSTAKTDTRKLSGNIVHMYPTIAALATFASRTALACFRHRTEASLARCLEMTKMVESYSAKFPAHHPSLPPPYNDVVLITGTTGLLGSNLLAQFLQSPRVTRVYALNSRKSRPGSPTERQATLMHASGLDPALARHPKLVLLETDARRSSLGLPPELYDKLHTTVTHVVHNAWLSTYDADAPLKVFDGSFRMLRNLVDFALSSPLPVPPRLLFISSNDTLRGASAGTATKAGGGEDDTDTRAIGLPVVAEGPASACDAAGDAYGESKWVGEQILAAATAETPLRPIIVRVGPLCGAANGRWREEDLLPKLVRLSVTLGALPEVDETVHWIPVHTAAQAVVEMRNALSTYLHVTHPRPTSSLTLLRCLAEALGLPLVPLAQWTARLEAKVHATHGVAANIWAGKEQDPALGVLRRLRQVRETAGRGTGTGTMQTGAPTVFGHVRMASDDAWFASPTLHGGLSALGMADVQLWVRHWREVGLIPAPASSS